MHLRQQLERDTNITHSARRLCFARGTRDLNPEASRSRITRHPVQPCAFGPFQFETPAHQGLVVQI